MATLKMASMIKVYYQHGTISEEAKWTFFFLRINICLVFSQKLTWSSAMLVFVITWHLAYSSVCVYILLF
jgi:hypothetical protein